MKYSKLDKSRPVKEKLTSDKFRSEFRRDYGRLIHCSSFRRLQGKTQLFPGQESDFFRNRLTHSIEVAQIAHCIADKLNYDLKSKKIKGTICANVVELASLAHDLGHPPFGHLGEQVLDDQMRELGGFEGNAQTLRILSRLEKKFDGNGLNLTYRSLGSILKYDRSIPWNSIERQALVDSGKIEKVEKPVKGYYAEEDKLVNEIKSNITGGKKYSGEFKTIECQIMDIADDIAYCTYDLEDTFKADLLKPDDILFASDEFITKVISHTFKSFDRKISIQEYKKLLRLIFGSLFPKVKFSNPVSKLNLEQISTIGKSIYESKSLTEGSLRTGFTSDLVGRFVNAVSLTYYNDKIPSLSKILIKKEEWKLVEALKYFVYESQIESSRLKRVAYRGKEIIDKIFEALSTPKGYELLPEDFRQRYLKCSNSDESKRVLCDFVAGMTDRYAFEFYGILTSEMPQSIFKIM